MSLDSISLASRTISRTETDGISMLNVEECAKCWRYLHSSMKGFDSAANIITRTIPVASSANNGDACASTTGFNMGTGVSAAPSRYRYRKQGTQVGFCCPESSHLGLRYSDTMRAYHQTLIWTGCQLRSSTPDFFMAGTSCRAVFIASDV